MLPSVTAYALDRQKITLPQAFSSPLNMLILFFERDQQPVVDAWVPAVASVGDARTQTWLLPISQRENEIYRWWLNASYRGALTAYEPRHYTVPLYVDKAKFLQSLQISTEQNVAILLTDNSGRVLWRTAGPVTDGKKAELRAFLAKTPH